MKETCRAAVLYGKEDLRLEPVPVPRPGPEEVLVQVKACALCGSDLHAYLGQLPRIKFPRILGHEFAGVIADPRSSSSRQTGQRVCCSVDLTCETCGPCRQGRRNLCEKLQTIGFERDGAYCEFVCVPRGNLHLIPDSVSFEEASMVQTMTIAFNAVKRRGEVGAQDRVLILGCGPIGLCALAVAKVSGAKVYMADILDYRLEAAGQMGADGIFHAGRVDLVKAVLEITGSKGVDKVIEAAGGEQHATLAQATRVVKRGGVVVVAGTFSEDVAPVRINEIKSRELELRGSRGDVDDFPACIDLLASGKLRLDKLISHRIRLEDAEKGLRRMSEKSGNVMKIIMSP